MSGHPNTYTHPHTGLCFQHSLCHSAYLCTSEHCNTRFQALHEVKKQFVFVLGEHYHFLLAFTDYWTLLHLGKGPFTFRAFSWRFYPKCLTVHLSEERKTIIYRCRYSKIFNRNQCRLAGLAHSPYTTKIAWIRRCAMLSMLCKCQFWTFCPLKQTCRSSVFIPVSSLGFGELSYPSGKMDQAWLQGPCGIEPPPGVPPQSARDGTHHHDYEGRGTKGMCVSNYD